MNQWLHEGIERILAPESRPQVEEKMLRYIEEIKAFNQIHNIVSTSDDRELAASHILDSLAAVPHLLRLAQGFDSPHFADIGSGGGLPGIPLAAALPKFKFTLVERMTTRAAFLKNCIETLGLENAEVAALEAERVAPESFDICVFRAFRPLKKPILKVLLAMLKKGGFLVAYKARLEKIREEMEAISRQVPRYELVNLRVPFLEDHERNLVVIQKK